MRILAVTSSLLATLCAAGCGNSVDPAETGGEGGAPPMTCGSDEDCDDHSFCNGSEMCDPTSQEADERGCVAGENPCTDSERCDARDETCTFSCDVEPDIDGDGHDALDCGGDDCDDSDRNRYPGNEEVCDTAHRDEDCDPNTFGFRDQDDDGEADAACCNVSDSGNETCGTDCDDTAPSVNRSATEVCDGIDNDCDGDVDEGVRVVYFEDEDGDGFGSAAPGAERVEACPNTKPDGFAAGGTDCDDTRQSVNPAAVEFCDSESGGVDENCNGSINEGCGCTAGETVECCGTGVQECDSVTGTFGACSITPTDEVCDGEDNDCDGSVDEGFQCIQGSAAAACTTPGSLAGERQCLASCVLDLCRAPEQCNGLDDDADGLRDEDFTCEQGRVGIPCITACGTNGTGTCNNTCDGTSVCVAPAEACNYCDDNGANGIIEEKLLLVALGETEGDKMQNLIECAYDGSEHGAAVCETDDSPPGPTFDLYTILLDGTENYQTGTVWPLQADTMGWGPVEIEFEIEVRGFGAGYDITDMSNLNPVPRRGGFTVSLTTASSGDGSLPVTGGAGHVSVHYTWGYEACVQPPNVGQPGGPPANFSDTTTTDGVLVRGKNGLLYNNGSNNPCIPYLSQGDVLGGDDWATVPMYILYAPDDPTTPLVDEERLLVQKGKGGATIVDLPDAAEEGEDTYVPPNDEFPVGTPFSIAIGAYSAGIPYEARIRSWRLTPPTGPGEVLQQDNFATIKRSKLCPYQLGL